MKELDQKHLDRFRSWALERYTERTTTKLVADVQTLVRYEGDPPEAKLRVKRLRDYLWAWNVWSEDWGRAGALPVPKPVVPSQKVRGGRRAREPKRLREAVSYPRAEYDAICREAAASDTDESRIILVIARTGLRIGDVLRTPLRALRDGFKRDDGVVILTVKGERPSVYSVRGGGESEKAWKTLVGGFSAIPSGWIVAEGLMRESGASPEAGGAAYQRVVRELRRIGAAAGVSGRVHLHRFRRSVAVYLAIAGATEAQIQATIIHQSPATTRGYMDEARALESAKLLGRIG